MTTTTTTETDATEFIDVSSLGSWWDRFDHLRELAPADLYGCLDLIADYRADMSGRSREEKQYMRDWARSAKAKVTRELRRRGLPTTRPGHVPAGRWAGDPFAAKA